MKLFDSHCHLDDREFDKDRDHVITRADDMGVKAVMIVGIGDKSSEKALAIAEAYPGFYASVGVHPHIAKDFSEEQLDHLKTIARSPKIKAWGETGLDFNRMYSPRDDQEKCFIRQIETADELDLPLIFHERDSNGRFLEIVSKHHNSPGNGVVHCFSGNESELKAYLELGYYIGITGILTQKERGTDLRKLVPLMPPERIVIETDAPYLTPAPEKNRTRRNEPAFVKSTLMKLSEVMGEDPERLADAVWKNTRALYHI